MRRSTENRDKKRKRRSETTRGREKRQVVLQSGMGDNPAKFDETWKAWKHQVDVYENLTAFNLDDDVKVCVVLREEPPKLRDNLRTA